MRFQRQFFFFYGRESVRREKNDNCFHFSSSLERELFFFHLSLSLSLSLSLFFLVFPGLSPLPPPLRGSKMFRGSFQTGYLTVFNAVGSKPLQLWETDGGLFF